MKAPPFMQAPHPAYWRMVWHYGLMLGWVGVTGWLWWQIGHHLWPKLNPVLLASMIAILMVVPPLPYADFLERYKRWRLQRTLRHRQTGSIRTGYTAVWVTAEALQTLHNCHAGAKLDRLLLQTIAHQLPQDLAHNQQQQAKLMAQQPAPKELDLQLDQLTARAQIDRQVLEITTRILNQEKLALLTAGQTEPLYLN